MNIVLETAELPSSLFVFFPAERSLAGNISSSNSDDCTLISLRKNGEKTFKWLMIDESVENPLTHPQVKSLDIMTQ